MGATEHTPRWVVPTARELTDCLWIARACAEEAPSGERFEQIAAVVEWLSSGPSRDEAGSMMRSADGAAFETIVWLLGHRKAPLRLPRRNRDGTVMTEAQLYNEYLADKWDGPEERRAAEAFAHREARRSRDLAALVPH